MSDLFSFFFFCSSCPKKVKHRHDGSRVRHQGMSLIDQTASRLRVIFAKVTDVWTDGFFEKKEGGWRAAGGSETARK